MRADLEHCCKLVLECAASGVVVTPSSDVVIDERVRLKRTVPQLTPFSIRAIITAQIGGSTGTFRDSQSELRFVCGVSARS
jgi:hypothetical protein